MPTAETNGDLAETSEDTPPPTKYPDGEKEDELSTELTLDELKAAFRLFDDVGEGFITVSRFRAILKEIDETFTDDEIDDIILDTDLDKSDSIDFDEWVKLMS